MDLNLDEMDIAMSQMDDETFINETDKWMADDGINETMSQMDMTIFDSNCIPNPEQQIGNADDVYTEMIEIDVAEGEGEACDAYGDGEENGASYVEASEDELDVDVDDIPIELLQQYEEAKGQILPNKSASRYFQAYEKFLKWQESKHTKSFDEKVIFCYFFEASEKYKPSTLWSTYSMLKKTLICKQNVDISKYCQLRAFLKTKCDRYQSKKSEVFDEEEVRKFMVEAPNIIYLGMKAVAVFGVIGGCRCDELLNLRTGFIKDDGKEISVKIPYTKTKKPKLFSIDGEFAQIVREYMKLRPPNTPTTRFFQQYRNGKCTNQVMGKQTIAKVPKEIAKFLGLPNPETYTGHGLRRTSTTILADTGVGIETLKRHGPWKSTAVCEGYIQTSKKYKRKVGNLIASSINLPSTSAETVSVSPKRNFFDGVFDVASDGASGSGMFRSISGRGASDDAAGGASGSGTPRSISGGSASRGVDDGGSGGGSSSGIPRSISGRGASDDAFAGASGSGMPRSISGRGASDDASAGASGSGMPRSISGGSISRGVSDTKAILKDISFPGNKENVILYFGGQITNLNLTVDKK